jgi:peptidoglycan hydrolase-like amidase
MPLLKRLTALAGTAVAARTYARRNPDKVNKMATKAGQFIDKRTKGKYHHQIDGAMRKVQTMTGQQHPGQPGPTH